MKDHLIALFLIFLFEIRTISAAGTSLHENIACPKVTFSAQNTSTHLDDIHHLECQLNISREHKRFRNLREEAHSISDSFNKVLHTLNEKTLDSCTQVHKDLTEPESRSYRAQLSDWAPIIFNSPIERFVSCGQIFLDGLEPLKHKALKLAHMNEHDISGCLLTPKAYCEGKLAPCMDDDASTSSVRSSLELRACSKIEALEDVTQAAKEWTAVVRDIGEIRKLFSSTWGLVKDAQEEEQKATEEWVANVVAKWISMLEDLIVRAEKRSGGITVAGTPTIRQPTLPLPLFYVPMRLGR
ncbi:hypothetical protein KCU95_g4746, partial [Aureobasidium melanogenum]